MITIELSENEALVLFEWLQRFNSTAKPHIFEDQAEQRVLWNLEASLETSLPMLFSPDYSDLLKIAHADVRDAPD